MNSFGGSLNKISLQKILFLFTKRQQEPVYHFIPYKYGCFSYHANQDLNTLQKYKTISLDGNNWLLLDEYNYTNDLKATDREILAVITKEFTNYNTKKLIAYTYNNFPYYAINSEIRRKQINNKINTEIDSAIPVNDITALYTIGYEGMSFEEYLNKLIKKDVKVLCDVRKNPVSMKYGFSKNQLKRACEQINIRYEHLPGLGIDSNLRKDIYAQDRNALFKHYRETTLITNNNDQDKIIEFVNKYKRVALTCFESDLNSCHRLHLAENIINKNNISFTCTHI